VEGVIVEENERKLLVKAGWEIITMSPEKSYHLPIRNFSRNICVLIKKQSTPQVPAAML